MRKFGKKNTKKSMRWILISLGIGCGIGFITPAAKGQFGIPFVGGIPYVGDIPYVGGIGGWGIGGNIPYIGPYVSLAENIIQGNFGSIPYAGSYINSALNGNIPGLGSIPYVGGTLESLVSSYGSGWASSYDMGASNIAQMNTELPLLSAEKGFLGEQLNTQESDAIYAAQLARTPSLVSYEDIRQMRNYKESEFTKLLSMVMGELVKDGSNDNAVNEYAVYEDAVNEDAVNIFMAGKEEMSDKEKVRWGNIISEKVPLIAKEEAAAGKTYGGCRAGALSSYVLLRWGVVCLKADRVLAQKLLDASRDSAEITFDPQSAVFADWLDNHAVFSSLLGNSDQAEESFEKALEIRSAAGTAVDSYERLYRFYLSQYRFTKAEEYLDRFLEIYKKKTGANGKVNNSHQQGGTYGSRGRTTANQPSSAYIDPQINLLYAEGLANRGIINFFKGRYYESLNDQNSAEKIIDETLNKMQTANQKGQTALSWIPLCRVALYDRLAQNYICQQKYGKAEEMLGKSIELRKQIEREQKTGKKIGTIALNGTTYDVFQEEPGQSYRYYYYVYGNQRRPINAGQESEIQMDPAESLGDVVMIPEKNILAAMYIKQARFDRENRVKWDELLTKAVEQTTESIEMLNNAELGSSIQAVETLRLQASAEKLLDKREAAIQDLLEAQRILTEDLKASKHFLTGSLACSLGELYLEEGNNDEAQACFEKAERIYEERGVSHPSFIDLYYGQARLYYNKGDIAEAEKMINKAIDYSCEARRYSSVDDQDRAVLFAEYYYLYETALGWMVEKEDWAEVFRLMEISRAQGFQDMMNLSESALLERITSGDSEKGKELRDKRAKALSELVEAKKALNKAGRAGETEERKAALCKDVAEAQQNLIAVSNEIKLACHTAGYIMDEEHRPADFAKVQQEIAESGLVVCEYFIGDNASWLLVYGKGAEPKAYPLQITSEQAGFLQKLNLGWNVSEGTLTADRLLRILNNGNNTGVLNTVVQAQNMSVEDIEESDSIAFYTQLHMLWEALLPDSDLRSRLLQGESEGLELLIIPDGVLAQLPFEMLVTEWDDNIKNIDKVSFFLDKESAPIFYAQSATVYSQMRESSSSDHASVITAGDPDYQTTKRSDHREASAVTINELERLPKTADEVTKIENVCNSNNIACTKLLQSDATEKNVTNEIDKEFVHLACHGLVDYQNGNMFGALALTPVSEDDSSDDGLFTLAEMLNLKLNGCELAILSACNTNLGAVQQGEGTWSLGRGMALAGARRVVTSDWSVSDDSTSNLIGRFVSNLLDEKENTDYAKALKDAKLYIRDESNGNWTHPYYWAPFILLGSR